MPGSYSEFTLADIQALGIKITDKHNLFAETEEIAVSPFLQETFQRNFDLALAVHTEQALLEYIVAPILNEVRILLNKEISLFPGVKFNVDPAQGLKGTCDFLISRSDIQSIPNAPIVAIVEAKDDNIKEGLGQCAAAMIAARIFNERQKNGITTIYGAVTTGSNWKFLKLAEPILWIDLAEYYINQPGKILGILIAIVTQKD